MNNIPMTGIILAGGRATRYHNTDKGTLEFKGSTIIDSAVHCLSQLFPTVSIVTNKPDLYRRPGVEIVEDDVEYLGSLNGVLCGLRASKTQYNFVTACDMPFLRESIIRFLLEQERDYDVLSPESEKGLQPLFSIYSRSCIPLMEERVEKRMLKIQDIFPLLNTKKIPMEKFRELASVPDPFFNVNRPEDLEKAKGMEE